MTVEQRAPATLTAVSTAAGALALALAAALLGGALGSLEHVLRPGTLAPAQPGWDVLAAGCAAAAVWLGARTATWVACTPAEHDAAAVARVAAVVTLTGGMLQSVLLLGAGSGPADSWWRTGATAAAVCWLTAAGSGGAVALRGAVLVLWRAATHSSTSMGHYAELAAETVVPRPLERDDPPTEAVPEPHDDAARWRASYTVPDCDPDAIGERWRHGTDTTGFCLSGGGIRSASVAAGALQSLRRELLDADVVVSVSGGGYTLGALQHALTDAPPRTDCHGEVLRDPATVFAEGSPEFDHLRRHASYLGDTPAQLLGALARLARGMLLSLAVLFGPAVVLGVLTGWLYDRLPITPLTLDPLGYPVPRAGALVAVGVLALVAFGLALFTRGSMADRTRAARFVRPVTALALVAAALTLAVPCVVWLSAWLLDAAGHTPEVGGSVGAVLLTYVSAVAGMAWRHRAMLGQQISGMFRQHRSGGIAAMLPTSVLQRLLVIVTMGVLALGWLLVFGGCATLLGSGGALVTAGVVAVVVAILGGALDVTSLSLHPFFRQRLAEAFALRLVRRHADGQVVAVPYDHSERSTLSEYGRCGDDLRFPRVVFACTAALTGEGRAAPGLSATPFTMSADWTGGPDVGWVRTADLERLVTRRFRRDLTVQGAVATSAAAFASAMGNQSRWFQVLFAVSGARLGIWLPNPAFVHRRHEAAKAGDWTFPSLPRARRLPYLAREVLGVHSHRDRLLHVSDGGHYDALGLIELFRRRCTRIYCIDASNDTPPTARTLAATLALAHQELGVRVELDDPWRAEPGRGEALDGGGGLTAVNAKLAEIPIITGTIHYPPESGLGDAVRGRLVVARALLWPELPYPLLSYASANPEFPHDSTGDQWFTDAKFTAYTELGRRLGEQARAAAGADGSAIAETSETSETSAAEQPARHPGAGEADGAGGGVERGAVPEQMLRTLDPE